MYKAPPERELNLEKSRVNNKGVGLTMSAGAGKVFWRRFYGVRWA